MILVVPLMREFVIQSQTKRMKLANVTARKMLAADDATNVSKAFGIWMPTIRLVVSHARATHWERLEISVVIFTRVNVYASVW